MSGTRKQYRIGEAARLLALKTCVLRFWEGEFPQLAPSRTPKGQRLYSEADMALLFRIRSLLHERGMTIAGARRVLEGTISAPADGARRVLEGDMSVPASAPPSLSMPPAPPAVHAGAAEPGGAEGDTAEEARQALADAAAELEGLRELLSLSGRSAPSPASPPSPCSSTPSAPAALSGPAASTPPGSPGPASPVLLSLASRSQGHPA